VARWASSSETFWGGDCRVCHGSHQPPLGRWKEKKLKKQKVLFLCTHNSARSQMAEAFLRHHAGDRFEVMSAGKEATRVRPLAIRAMDEIGIDISHQESKSLDRYLEEPFDYVITVCDEANEACPIFPGAKNKLHWSFEDPSQAEGSEDERLAVFRRVRDEIRERIEQELVHNK
jgi:arsenate reductase (thioredoxin)